jgi:F-type H+-transporting ATPase subunit delta
MVSGSVARRYAKALFGLAVEGGRVEAWSDALDSLAEVLRASPDLAEALGSPLYSRDERRAVVDRLASALRLDPEPANLLRLLGDRGRLDRLPAVLQAFRELADAHLGRLRARVVSAAALDPAAADAMAARLSQSTRAKVLLERTVDPALLGGVVATVGSLVYDGSIRTQLEELRKSLKR